MARGEIPRLAVFMPPRHGKSQLISELGPAWYLGNWPDRRVMLASNTAALASDFGRKARDHLAEWGPELFDVEVREDSRAANRWNIAGRTGGMVTAGVGGPLTGMGADLLIIDDPVKNAEEAISETIQAKHIDWWRSTASTRLHPGAGVVLVQTRWHELDLAGQILADDGEEWEVISLPAYAEADDPLGRAEGEPLWPWRYGMDELERRRKESTEFWWSAMYMQRPAPAEGGIFKRDWFKRWKPGDFTPQTIMQSWDMSFKDTKDSSYVVGQLWAVDQANKYLLDQVRGRMSFTRTCSALEAFTLKADEAYPAHKSHLKLVEDKANGPAVIDALGRRVSGLVGETPKDSKEARAHAVSPQVEAGNVHLPADAEWLDDFLHEVCTFPNAANDDQVDAMTQALKRLGATSSGAVRTGRWV